MGWIKRYLAAVCACSRTLWGRKCRRGRDTGTVGESIAFGRRRAHRARAVRLAVHRASIVAYMDTMTIFLLLPLLYLDKLRQELSIALFGLRCLRCYNGFCAFFFASTLHLDSPYNPEMLLRFASRDRPTESANYR